MEFREFLNKKFGITQEIKEIKEAQENQETQEVNDNAYYFNMLNPDTGLRFDIPMLSPVDPNYFFQYIYYMKLRETSPDTFKKLLTWD